MEGTSESRRDNRALHAKSASFARKHRYPGAPFRQKKAVDNAQRVRVWTDPIRYTLDMIAQVKLEAASCTTGSAPLSRQIVAVKARNSIQGGESAWAMRSRTVIDEETRLFKVTLNKLAPTNYDKLSEELRKMIKPDLIDDLSQFIMDRASVETKYLPVYADLSRDLSRDCIEFKRRLIET